MPPTFPINVAASLLGISTSTVRYYERQGVIPGALRSRAGQRVYSLADVHKIAQTLYPNVDLPSLLQPPELACAG